MSATKTTDVETLDRIDASVEAFEEASARDSSVAVGDYLPEPGDPLFAAIGAELLRVDLELRWRRGCPKDVREYQREFPALLSEREVLAQVAFEEYRVRCRAGDGPSPAEYERRFRIDVAAWPAEPLEAAEDPQQAAVDRLAEASDEMPQVGSRWLDFDLIGELGRGTFGHVFLARQGDLAHRLVVLKVSPHLSAEPENLAQLQHTNIVPIFSAHRTGALHAVCMPYFGKRTLADVLLDLRVEGGLPGSGARMLSTFQGQADPTLTVRGAVDRPDTADADAIETGSSNPADHALAQLGPVDAAVWVAEAVAAGLAHAHQRGVVHSDLKPANILLADDGRPMILDFNLATSHRSAGDATVLVGGTLAYMSGEHLEAVRDGRLPDRRGDVFALGVMLYEMLAGRRPFPTRLAPFDEAVEQMIADRQSIAVPIERLGPAVPPAVGEILRRCLAPDPLDRYESAEPLHEDLRRQLNDLPLRHAPNRSMAERCAKWFRRHPRVVSAGSVATICTAVAAIAAIFWGVREHRLAGIAAQSDFALLQHELPTWHVALTAPDLDAPLLQETLEEAHSQLAAYGHVETDAWRNRSAYRRLAPDRQQQVQRDLGRLLYLLAAASARLADDCDDAQRARLQEQAIGLFERSEMAYSKDGTPRVVLLRHADALAAAGDDPGASQLRHLADMATADDVGEGFLQAVAHYTDADYESAAETLGELCRRTPQDVSARFVLANAKAGMHLFAEAESDYSVCIALRPGLHLAYFNRGLCRLELDRYDTAAADFTESLRLRPGAAATLINRALAHRGAGRAQMAVDDLTAAIDAGSTPTRVFFLRARLWDRLGDRGAAERDRREGLRRRPDDEKSWIARGIARLDDDAEAALADFQHALALNSRSRLALRNIAHVCSERLDRKEEAIAALDAMLKLDGQDSVALGGRGILHARLGRRDAALADARAALRCSDDPKIVLQAACIHALTADEDERRIRRALALVGEALRQDPRLARLARIDPDLEPVRGRKEFDALLTTAGTMVRLQQETEQIRTEVLPQ